MDTKNRGKELILRVKIENVKRLGPPDPADPASVAAHERQLSDLENELLSAKLSINDDDPDRE